jgi:hypothetical protein
MMFDNDINSYYGAQTSDEQFVQMFLSLNKTSITAMKIYNRQDCCQEGLLDVYVLLSVNRQITKSLITFQSLLYTFNFSLIEGQSYLEQKSNTFYTVVAGSLRLLDNSYFAAYGHPFYAQISSFDFVKNLTYGSRLDAPLSPTGYLYFEQSIPDFYLCISSITIYDKNNNVVTIDPTDIVIGSPATPAFTTSPYNMSTLSQNGKNLRIALGSNSVSRIQMINNVNVFRQNWRNVSMVLVTPSFNFSTIIPYPQDLLDFYFNATTLVNVKTNNHQAAKIYYMNGLRSNTNFGYFLNYPDNYRNMTTGKIYRFSNGVHFNTTSIETYAYNGLGSVYNIIIPELMAIPAIGANMAKDTSAFIPYWMIYLVFLELGLI